MNDNENKENAPNEDVEGHMPRVRFIETQEDDGEGDADDDVEGHAVRGN